MKSDIYAVHHIQLALPAGGEAAARDFYAGILGLEEVPKPEGLARRGGVWFQAAGFQIHLGVDLEFRAARRAHPGLLVRNLERICQAYEQSGASAERDSLVEGYRRAFLSDPFGNRIELLESLAP
jgi:catechol 2,3-dioxygenase-like lactoylglutathione lyase family enzyme